MNALLMLGISFLILLMVGFPIFAAVGLSSVIYLLLDGSAPLVLIPQKIFSSADNFSMLALPLFMLMGELMNSGGITKVILNFAKKAIGHIRGGLLHVTTVASMIFASMCGSSAATAASIGGMMIPALRDDGYDDDLIGSVVASGACLGPIIPPSIILVIYASISGDSIAKLFLGGAIPGVIMGLLYMVVSARICKKRGYELQAKEKAPMKEVMKAFFQALPSLAIPIISMGGILMGVFTATEGGAIASAYALILSVINREMTVEKFITALYNAAKQSANVMLIMGTGATLGWILTKNQVPQMLTKMLIGITSNPILLMFIIIGFILFLGCFLTEATIVPVLAPLLLPVIKQVGFDPIAFGVILCSISVAGALTPPVGGMLFVTSGVGNIPVMSIAKTVIPYLGIIVFVLLLCSVFPGIVSFLPNLLVNV